MKIKFSLIESYETSTSAYLLTFIIHEQDMNWRNKETFIASNRIHITCDHFCYLTTNTIYLLSQKKLSWVEKGFEADATSHIFKTKADLIAFKQKAIQALKEWSHE